MVTTTDDPVVTTGLTKLFRHQVAVDAVDLRVPAGAVYGFLGPNGSGKTTTIRMLLGLISPTSGSHTLLGEPMPAGVLTALPRVGALVEGPAFHPYLSGRENLHRLDAADGSVDARTAAARIDGALDRVGLLSAATKRFRAYSLGMKQRLAIAAALLRPRELLVLDEPTNGLDPQGTREVRHLIGELAADGITVLISSHLLSEVEQMCSHIGVMNEGKLLVQGPIADLQANAVPTVRLDTPDPDTAARTLTRLGLTGIRTEPGVTAVSERDRATRVTGVLGDVQVANVVPELVAADVTVLGFGLVVPTLEDVFVQLTGEGFDVSG